MKIVEKQIMDQSAQLPPSLVYVSSSEPGFTRKKWGKGFIYVCDKGEKIGDKQIIQRIKKFVIPPIWDKVWICKKDNGHLQVTGKDLKNRTQYIYHPLWNEFQQQSKFRRMVEFGYQLSDLRLKLNHDLSLKGWPQRKVLALVVKLLDEYYIRIGNKFYERNNHTYGLTTLRRKHLDFHHGKLELSYKAKSNKYRNITIDNPKLKRLVKNVSQLPGYEVFKYLDENKHRKSLDSGDVNEYIRELTGNHFSAKDFRTWGGTVLSIDYYEDALDDIKKHPARKLETAIIKRVAQTLGNTVAICRDYYMHPKVLEVLVNGDLEEYKKLNLKGLDRLSELSESEKAVLKIIQ